MSNYADLYSESLIHIKEQNRSIKKLEAQLAAVRRFAEWMRVKYPVGGNECEKNRMGIRLQAILEDKT